MNDRPTAVVTGAGRGIGRGIVLELANEGFDIVGVDVVCDPSDLESGLFEVKKRVESLGSSFLPARCDVASLDDHVHVLEETLHRFGKVDLLVNNAGVAPERRMDILETTPESYDRVMSINARGTFFLTQRFAVWMVRRVERHPSARKPRIVFITSISAVVSSPSRAEYCVSKAALSHAARMFADRLSGHGIDVFEIRPGIIQTDMTASVKDQYDKRIAGGLVPQNRWGFPDDVGKAVAAMAKGAFPYATGMILEMSGGMNIRRL